MRLDHAWRTYIGVDGMSDRKPEGLELLRQPFPRHLISKLPKPTKKQTDEVRADFRKGIRCHECGQWHHPDVVHLDYVGHAALTDRLLDCDPEWNWSPLSATGLPEMDAHGGMWITLTVCGVSRIGYGHPDGKTGGNAIKEVIGDALRNAAMRFGAALDLWHKGDLHGPEEDDGEAARRDKATQEDNRRTPPALKEPVVHSPKPEALRDTLIGNVQHHDDPRYKADLERLRAISEEFAGAVDDAIVAHISGAE